MNNTTPSLRQIITEVKQYLSLQYEWIKLDSVEKLTRIVSALIMLIISIILVATTLFYLSFATVHLLEPYVGTAAAFAIMAGAFVLLLALLWILRVPCVVTPLLRFFYKMFVVKDNSEKTTSNNNLPSKDNEL